VLGQLDPDFFFHKNPLFIYSLAPGGELVRQRFFYAGTLLPSIWRARGSNLTEPIQGSPGRATTCSALGRVFLFRPLPGRKGINK